jgi:signal peptidase II
MWSWAAGFVILLDQLTKNWAVASLIPYEPLRIFPFISLTLAHNTGAAFSFLHAASGWQNILFVCLAVVVCIAIVGWMATISARDWWMGIALSLIAGGAVGNVCDRLLYGYVIDFFDFHISHWHFAIFNVADSAICIGAAMLLLRWLIKG